MTPTEVIYGKDCFVYVKNADEWYLIGCGISFTFEIENELILRTGINDGLFPKKRVRQTSFRGTINAVMISESDSDKVSSFYFAQEAVRRTENTFRFEFTDQVGLTKTITGNFLVQTLNKSADVTSFAKFDMAIEGTGPFTIDEVDSPTPGADENVDSDYWTTTPGATSISGLSVNGKSTAGKILLHVSREGATHDIVTGTPSGRQAKHTSGTTSFDSGIPFNSGETVWQVWKDA